MLLANMATARKIALAFPNTALLRRHQAPKEHLATRLVGVRGLPSPLHTHTGTHAYTDMQVHMCPHSSVPPPQEEVMESLGMPVDTSSAGTIHVREWWAHLQCGLLLPWVPSPSPRSP